MLYFQQKRRENNAIYFRTVSYTHLSIITSSFIGENLSKGNLWMTVTIFAIAGALGIGGILFNNYFLDRMNSKREKKGKNTRN